MLVNDTNFVTPSFNEVKPDNNINLISPLNFLKTAQNNSPIEKPVESTFDWKKDFDSFIQTAPKKYDLTTYYNEKQYEKYHKSLLGKPIFKDPRYYDNEDLNAQRQGFLGSLFNGTMKMSAAFNQSFVSTFNPFGYDNTVSNAMQDFSKNMENWFPNYYSKEERENPLSFNSIFSGNFLGDKLIKNLGFMEGAITAALMQDAIVGFMTGGTALAPTIALQTGRAANWLSKAFKANTIASKLVAADKVENFLKPLVFKGEKALEYFNNMTKGQKILTGVKTNLFLANAAHGEAAIEALEGLTRVREDLIQSYKEKNGILPDAAAMAEINKLASEAGNIRYGLNFATIFLTDAIQFGSLFKPFKSYTTGQTLLQGLGGSGERLVLNEAGQLVRRNLSKSEKVLGALTGDLVQANISESLQEGLQYSFETATHDYAKKKWNKDIRGGLGDYLHEQVNGLKRMVTDVEGRESMLLGFLTGFAAHGFKKGVEKLQGRPSLEKREDSIMSDFNSIDFDKMFDTTELSELVKRDVETFNGRTTQEIILNQMQDAIKSGNVFDFKSLQHELFFNGIRTANALGKFDAFVEKLEAMKQLAPEEFSKVFGIEVKDSNVVSQYIDKLKDQAVKTKEIIEAVDNTIPNTIDYKKESKLWTAFNDLKTTMAFHLSSLDNITSRIDSVTSTLLENNPSMTEDLIDKISDIENFSNKFLLPLNQERRSLLNTLEVMSQLKEEKDEALFNKTKQQLKDLDDHIDNLNKHANTIKEHFNKTNNWTADAILNYKQLVLEVLQYNQQKESGNKIAYTETQLEDTLKALIDFQKLKKSLGIVIDESNKLQTPEGRDKYLRDHIAFLEKYSDSFSEMIKKVNITTVKKFRDQEIATIASNISDNITQIEAIKNQIEEIDKQLLDEKTTPEEKELLEKRKEELIKEKQELLDENKELEETKEVIKGKEELTIEEQIQLLEKELSTIEDDNNPRIKEIDDEISKLEKLLKNESEEDLNSETEDKTSIEDVNPVETPTETGEKEIIITETPNLILEAKKAPLHGKSRVLMTVGKMGNTLPKDMKFAGGMLQNFYNFMGRFETFDGNLHMHNLNSFLSRNKYKFVLMVAPDVLYTKPDENGRSEYFTEGTQNPDNIVIVLVDETNNPVLIDGNYIASKVGKDATQNSAWLNEGKLPDDNQSLVDAIKEVREKGFADLAIESTSAGHYNFIGKKEKFEIKELNPNTSFEIFTHTELKEMGNNFRGYTLLPGKLYLKVVNGRKTVMYLDVSLAKMSNIKVKGEPISKNIFDLINHLNNNEESDVYRQNVKEYLNSIFHTYHITKGGRVPAIFKVGESFYKFEVNITENNASIRIIKDGEVAYELSKEKQDELSKLQSLLKIFDINDKIFFGKEINLPTIEDGKLRFNLIPYTDFILENANPTVNYKLDFSTENPFEYTNGEIYFKLPSKVEEAFSETSTTQEQQSEISNQSKIEDKKADTERRRQELESSREILTLYDLTKPITEDSKEIISKIEEANKLRKEAKVKNEQAAKETNEEKRIALNSDADSLNEKAQILDKEVKASRDSVINNTPIKQAITSAKILGQKLLNKIKLAAKSNEWVSSMPISKEEFTKFEDAIKRLSVKNMGEVTSNSEVIPDILLIEEINAKYDAELDSLKSKTATDIEVKRVEIEKLNDEIDSFDNEYNSLVDIVNKEDRRLNTPKSENEIKLNALQDKINILRDKRDKIEQSLKETTKAETTSTTSNKSKIEAKKAEIEILKTEKQKKLNDLKQIGVSNLKTIKSYKNVDVKQTVLNLPINTVFVTTQEGRDKTGEGFITQVKDFFIKISETEILSLDNNQIYSLKDKTSFVKPRNIEIKEGTIETTDQVSAKYDAQITQKQAELKALEQQPTTTTQTVTAQPEIEVNKSDIEIEIKKLEEDKQEFLKPLIEEKEQVEKEIKELEAAENIREEKGKKNNIIPISTKEADRILKYLSKKYGILGVLTDLLPEFTYGKFTTEKILVNKNTYYDEKGDITFEPKGFVNKITIYHEYLHPFVQILERVNPELYEKIYQDSLSSDIDVSHYIKDVRKEERVVRYLDKLSAQEKIPSLLQQFLDFLSDLFFKNKKSDYKTLQKLNTNTTVEELYNVFKSYGNLKEGSEKIKEERFLKLEATQLENLINLNAGDVESHKAELEVIKQRLDLLNRYDVDKLQQLKQRLEEVNKKIDDVTKRFDTQIAQKQAELKALEQQSTTSNQFEIQAKKADIKIGKVGNTEYEVKQDGVYYQSKKLDNPKNLSHRQLIEADIERRRQEDLSLPVEEVKEEDTWMYDLGTFMTKGGGFNSTTKEGLIKVINAKYDAELKQLEQPIESSTKPTTTEIEAKKDEIERRRQEELNSIIPIKISFGGGQSFIKDDSITLNLNWKDKEQINFLNKVFGQPEWEQGKEYPTYRARWSFKNIPNAKNIILDIQGVKITTDTYKYQVVLENIDKLINAKYDAEPKVLEQQEPTIDEKTLEGFSSQEDLSKAFGIKPLEQSNDNSELTKEVVKPEKKSREKFNINKNTEKLFSSKKLSTIPSLNVTNTDIEKVKAIFKGNVNIENLFQIANSDAWATFQQSAITLFKGATRADLYHEAWHHFSQLYLTKDEKIKLYEETRNKVKDLKDKSDLEVEEYIAREFAKFTETGKIEGKFPERKSIFQKIMDFLKSIFSNETDLSLDSLFNNLYKGQINHLAYNTENIMFGKLNSSINDSFNYNDSKLIESGLNGLLVRVLKSEKASISEISKIRDINIVYRILENELKEMYNNLLDDNNVSSNDIFSDNLERLLENWNDVKKFHFENSIVFNKDKNLYTVNEEGQIVSTDENEDEKKGRNKADYQEASERSVFDILPSEIKNLIYTLVDKDKNGNEIIDPIFGLPKLVDYQRYVQVISQKLSDQTDFSDVEKVLTELSTTYPPMKDLLELLTLNDSNEVKQLRVKFINSMALAKVKLYTILYNEENKDYQAQDVYSNTRRQAESNAISYFNISPETRFIKKINGENQITQIGNVDYNEDNVALLKDLGMDMSFTDYMSTEQLSSFLKNLQIPFLVNHLRGYLKQYGVIKDVFKALNTKIDGQSRDSVFKRIVKADLEVNPAYISATSLNAENKLESENVLWSTITKDIKSIQKAKSISELVQNPNRSHFNFSAVDMDSSVLLNLMFDKNGNRTNFEISVDNYNGINNTKQGETGVKTKDVYYVEKAIMDISQFVNNNILTTMQLSNKATYLGFKLSNKLFNDKYDFEEKMLKYLFTELDIIEKFHNGDPELTKLKKLSEAIGTKNNYNFAIFKDIITYDTQEIINEYINTGNLSDKTKTNILEQINSFFNYETKLHANFLGENLSEIVPSSGSKYSKDTLKETLLDDYIKNQFIFNVELSKITFGNPYMHKDPYKRIAGATSTGTRLLVDDLTLQDFESATKETQRSSVMPLLLERLKLKEYNLKNQRSSNKELRFITFNDREMPSKYYNDLLDAVNSELSKHQENSPEYKALLEKKKSIQKAYSKVNGSDAMGAVTMDAWRKFNWLAGRWTPELEKIYEKTIKWDYHNRLLKQTTNEEEKVKQLALRNENAIDEAEKLAISVMKYQYYGNVKNTTIMEKAFHKYQLMPLIPQLIEGKLYEHHLDRMIMEDVDYLLFDSADKLEKTKTPNNFYNNKEQDNVFVLEDFVNTYRQGDTSYDVRTGFIENLKEQVFMENGTDNFLLFGTQVRALLFNTDSFSELYDEFRDVINQLTQIEKDKLYEKASLNSNGEVIDKNRFVQFLLDELDKKVVNYNVKDYLRLTKAGEFAGSLDTNLQRTPIESIINSVIQNKIVKQKMHGEMMVQVSNVGFETFGKKDSLKFYGYEQDGKVRKMEVKIPLSGKFKNLLNLTHSDGRKIETRERLNEMISKGLIDTRAITMIGYRIPTQEHNSVEVMIVQEFLDPISNLIVVPYEITAKAGSDFDIDKLNIFKPHIDENGNYITNIEKPTDLDYINLSEIKEKIKAKKETVQKSWEIQSNKLQKLYNERLINKEEVSNNIEELRYTLRETNIEIAFLKEDILILKELNQENKAVSNLLITIFSDNAIKNKNLEEIIKEKEDKILKYNNDNKLRKELIEQFKELSTKSSEEIVRIEKRKQTQEKYLSDLNALFTELNDISYKIKNYKASKQNRIIEIFEEVLLAPDNFINLITPNSTSLFDEAINNVFKVRYTEQERQEKKGVIMPKDIVYTNSLLPRNSWDMHRVFGDSGKGLGIAAVGNKFSQLIQKAKVNFTDEYLEKYNLRFKLGNLSNRNFQNGESKGTAFSQLINLLVDVANDPRVGYVNMGDDVIPIVNLMINFGIDIEQIIYLINQPIVVDYIDYVSKNSKRLIKGKNDKTSFSSYLATKVFNFRSSLATISKEYEIDKDSSATEIAEKLGNIPLKNDKENIGLKISQINSEEQLLILSQFVQFEEMAADFLELQMTMNFDTNLVQDGFEAFQKENSFEDIKTRNIFTNLDELKYNTVISPLNVLKEVVNINAQLLPLANSKLIYNFLSSKLSNDFKFKTNKHKAKFIRTFKNDFIMYLFQNFLGRSEKALLNFNTTFAPVLKMNNQDFTNKPNEFGIHLIKNLYKEFAEIKNNPKYKDLFNQYLLLDRLFVTSEEEFKNIGLSYYNKDSELQNTYIEQFKELLNNPDLEIKNFMLKFAYMGFYQSGLNKSLMSSTDVLPIKLLSPILENIREQYLLEINDDRKLLSTLYDFHKLMYDNNEFMRSNKEMKNSDGSPMFYDKNGIRRYNSPLNNRTKVDSKRFKNYTSNIDKVLEDAKPLIPSNTVQEEIFQEDKFIFEYKGKKINTEFELSEDQSQALKELIDFTKDSNESAIVLQGAAGTGKTSIIGYLQKYLNEQFLYTAPTHAATVELAFGTMKTGNTILPITVASSLRLNKDTDKYVLSRKAANKIGFGNIIVIDETSMLNIYDYKRLLDLKELGYKLIFIGDKKQIPEVSKVKDLDFKTISNAFVENKIINLDVIHRTSNKNIKNILQKVRDSITFQLFKLKENTNNVQFFKSDISFKQKLKEFVLKDPQNTDYIAYTNKAVSSMNKLIREQIFGRKGEIQKDDIVMGYLGYQSKQIEKSDLANSISYKVEKVEKTKNGYNLTLSSERLDKLREKGFTEIGEFSYTTLLPLSNKEAIENSFDQKIYDENNKELSIKFNTLYEYLQQAKKTNSGKDWNRYYNYHESLSLSMSKIDLADDYIYNIHTNQFESFDKTEPSKEHAKLLSFYKAESNNFIVEKGIDFGHAITVHKSQGRTTKNVFFDANTIKKGDTKIMEKDVQISTENQSLGYVGLSRASENLFVNEGWVSFEEIDTVEEDNTPTQQTTEQPIVKKITKEDTDKLPPCTG